VEIKKQAGFVLILVIYLCFSSKVNEVSLRSLGSRDLGSSLLRQLTNKQLTALTVRHDNTSDLM